MYKKRSTPISNYMSEPWFVGKMSRSESEALLETGSDLNFIVRESTNRVSPMDTFPFVFLSSHAIPGFYLGSWLSGPIVHLYCRMGPFWTVDNIQIMGQFYNEYVCIEFNVYQHCCSVSKILECRIYTSEKLYFNNFTIHMFIRLVLYINIISGEFIDGCLQNLFTEKVSCISERQLYTNIKESTS